ncbi:MAG TPA: flavin reductase family protein [Micromonosporaceae bacterium]|jgi:flavin reductase (DIM6/NTAB) family NADH-FMN oxidoreductase RutF|nr:flavin reductase family protein [Micromonosporaceae bacterium]
MPAVAGDLRTPAATTAGEQAGPADDRQLRDAFAQLPAGVSVVTSLGPHGPVGMTVSTVCSLSLDPPLLLLCAANECRTLAQLRGYGRFAVNSLPARHTSIARAFADPEPAPGHRFRVAAHHVVDAVPVLNDAVAVFTCALQDTYPGGDHTIVVGRILTATATNGAQPLLWHARGFRRLAPLQPEPTSR